MLTILDYIIGCTFILVRKKGKQGVGAALIPANMILALSTATIIALVIGTFLFERVSFPYLIATNLTVFLVSYILYDRLLNSVYFRENRSIKFRLPNWVYYISFPFLLLACGILVVALLLVTIKTAIPLTK